MTERIQEVLPDLKQNFRFSDHIIAIIAIIGILFFPILLMIFNKGWPSLYPIFELGLGLMLLVFMLNFTAVNLLRKPHKTDESNSGHS